MSTWGISSIIWFRCSAFTCLTRWWFFAGLRLGIAPYGFAYTAGDAVVYVHVVGKKGDQDDCEMAEKVIGSRYERNQMKVFMFLL